MGTRGETFDSRTKIRRAPGIRYRKTLSYIRIKIFDLLRRKERRGAAAPMQLLYLTSSIDRGAPSIYFVALEMSE